MLMHLLCCLTIFIVSGRWSLIKRFFTIRYNRENKKQNVWQIKFWEHQIRDERDYKNHVDYIHYNPVKHASGNIQRLINMLKKVFMVLIGEQQRRLTFMIVSDMNDIVIGLGKRLIRRASLIRPTRLEPDEWRKLKRFLKSRDIPQKVEEDKNGGNWHYHIELDYVP